MDKKKVIVAIDGFSSSGKSTMAKELARRLGYVYIDSGAMYRAVTLYALRHGMIRPDGSVDADSLNSALDDINIEFTVDAEGRSVTLLNGENVESEIRTLRVSDAVSPVSALAAVRHRLTALMQQMGKRRGIVMDGRDIGTTVFPDAEVKFFIEASPEIRARRRFLELEAKGQKPSYEEVYENICKRDHIDRTRKESPLRCAEDAIVVNNDHMSHDEQMEVLMDAATRIIDGER